MDFHQLRTFVAVAREGSITRASERLYLSQPAVSAHIKAIEDTLGLTLFDRTSRGMSLTSDGQKLLLKAEQTLVAHRDLIDEASRIKGQLTGRLHIGAGSSMSMDAVGLLMMNLSRRFPDVEVTLQHGTSPEILAGLRSGALDAGFYNEAGEPEGDLDCHDVAEFSIYLAAAPGLVPDCDKTDWQALGELPWIFPTGGTCCGVAAENVFRRHQFRPRRIISIDRESITLTLVTGGIGLGLLHATTALEAQGRGEVELITEVQSAVRVLFASLSSRKQDPLISALRMILQEPANTPVS
ncbi:MAG: LysR family transcriptional regulator [Pannonibacter sp.]